MRNTIWLEEAGGLHVLVRFLHFVKGKTNESNIFIEVINHYLVCNYLLYLIKVETTCFKSYKITTKQAIQQ